MVLKFDVPTGATPLEQEYLEQLIPDHITTMAQLNEAEQFNIVDASTWALARKRKDVLSEKFCKLLHKKMFCNVWKWAGQLRQRNVNIGNVEAYETLVRLHQLMDDCQHWAEDKTFPPAEIAARLHHGLTVIHAFPNGNGRHARLFTDSYLKNAGEALFTWGGGGNLVSAGEVRDRYLAALRAADNHEIQPLIDFAQS